MITQRYFLAKMSANFNKNFAECRVSPVRALSHNRAKHKNSTKVYTADDDTKDIGKAEHMSIFKSGRVYQYTMG